jgi:CO/xanthine dehydrogenase FAD-binding subunit
LRSPVTQYPVVRPSRLNEALRALHDSLAQGRLVPLAGGTDVFVYLNAGTPPGMRYLDLQGLNELRGVRATPRGLTIGALTTFRDIRDHALIRRRLPSLVAAAAEIGAWQIQNRATLAGNIANASPAGDSLPVLLAHDAIVHVRSVRGARALRFSELYTGYRTLATSPDELIVAIELPFAPPRARPFFRKVGTRRAQSISKVVFCGLLRLDSRGRVDHARLAYGSVAPVPLRALAAEAALSGVRPSAAAAATARLALASDLSPIDDIRSSRSYRLAIAGNVLEQFLRSASSRFLDG